MSMKVVLALLEIPAPLITPLISFRKAPFQRLYRRLEFAGILNGKVE